MSLMKDTINKRNIGSICRSLAVKDLDLDFIFRTCGAPPVWNRKKGFGTLVQIILEQQVSLASAKAAFDKLNLFLEVLTPDSLLGLSDDELKTIGFSRQKSSYVRGLADAILGNEIDLDELERFSDSEVKKALTKIKGIGDWTADIYLLMALRRPDVMPRNDLALLAAYQKLKKLDKRPTSFEFLDAAEKWSPYRSVAARLLWHFYLSTKQ